MKTKEQKNIKINKILVFVVLFFVGLIIYRVGVLSLSDNVEGINLQEFANNRTIRKATLKANRGTVYDANGNPIAQNVSSYTLIAYLDENRTTDKKNPKHVVDKEYTATMLEPVLGIDKETILGYLNRNAYQVEFGSKGKNLTELKKDEILALNLPGLDFIETQKRYYPFGNFMSYTIGYAKKKNVTDDNGNTFEDIVGEMGIELYYNDLLTGEDGYNLYQKDIKGYKIPGTQEITVPAKDGADVYLTIDSNIQLFVERAIQDSLLTCSADFITIMVADAKTGAILASASYPSFDPNKRDMVSYLDYNVSYAFEPGSTMKIYSYMCAMENGVYNGEDKYKSGIFKTKDGTEIGDWNRSGWGYLSYDAGFALSSNTAVMNLIDKYMNASMLRDCYIKYGFGDKTGIELPNETSGKLTFKYETEILNAGFGQGITTTPIQNIKALTFIANDGVLLKPYIVDKIVDSSTGKTIYNGERVELGKVATSQNVEKIKSLMRSVVSGNSSNSTGYYYYLPGYDFIAKTGTAQIANTNGKGYSDKVTRGLAGMFPGNDPQILIYMAIQNPSCGTDNTKVLIQSIIKNISKYKEIFDDSNDGANKYDTITMSSYINKNVDSVVSMFNSHGINPVVIGNGDTIIKQSPNNRSIVNKIDKIFLFTNGDSITMPNIIGYSYKDFITLMSFLGIHYSFNGNGYVTSQSIPEGTVINNESILEVTLEAKEFK